MTMLVMLRCLCLMSEIELRERAAGRTFFAHVLCIPRYFISKKIQNS